MTPDHRTAVMGILNITPDSFSDGGRFDSSETAFRAAKRMAAQGADLIDLGAQSTRPGASDVGAEIELERLLPVLRRLQQARRDGDLPLVCCSRSTPSWRRWPRPASMLGPTGSTMSLVALAIRRCGSW